MEKVKLIRYIKYRIFLGNISGLYSILRSPWK